MHLKRVDSRRPGVTPDAPSNALGTAHPGRRGAVLFRRREVWVPTLWGTFALVVIAAALVTTFTFTVYGWLAANQPARGARTLVVEGWLNEEGLVQAVAAIERGRYERVVTTGGPIEPWADVGRWGTFAARAAAYLRGHVPAGVPIVAVPAPDTTFDRTYLNAVMLHQWAVRAKVDLQAIDLFSSGVHTRRSGMVYRLALGPGVEVGVLAAVPEDFHDGRWWATSASTKSTIGEALSVAWTACCFWPGPPGSHEVAAAPPPAPSPTR